MSIIEIIFDDILKRVGILVKIVLLVFIQQQLVLVRRGTICTLNFRKSKMIILILELLLILALMTYTHQSATRNIIVDMIISIYIMLVLANGNTVLNLKHLFLRMRRVRRIRDAIDPIVVLLTRSQSLADINIISLNFILQFLIVFKLLLEQLLVLQDLLLEEYRVNLITITHRQLRLSSLRHHSGIHLLLFIGTTIKHVHVLMMMVKQLIFIFLLLRRVGNFLFFIFFMFIIFLIVFRRLVDCLRKLQVCEQK